LHVMPSQSYFPSRVIVLVNDILLDILELAGAVYSDCVF
jgi:hypothetical protein